MTVSGTEKETRALQMRCNFIASNFNLNFQTN